MDTKKPFQICNKFEKAFLRMFLFHIMLANP